MQAGFGSVLDMPLGAWPFRPAPAPSWQDIPHAFEDLRFGNPSLGVNSKRCDPSV